MRLPVVRQSEFAKSIVPQQPIVGGKRMINIEMSVAVPKLIEVLRTNRSKHIRTFEEASAAFKEKYEQTLKEMAIDGKFSMRIDLTKPTCHTDSYDSLIKVLEMSSEQNINIASYELERIMSDNWDWKSAFDATSSMYISR
jgi:hypothetical protein